MRAKRLIVIGGGAAGFFCAINAARLHPGLQVTLLEKSSKLLAKVRVSGGGRCNVTHQLFEISEFSRRYPRGQNFLKKTLHQFDAEATLRWFDERGVTLKAEADGRMFPTTDTSETIIACLLREAERYSVEIRMNADVRALRKADVFHVELADGRSLEANAVCIATGGAPKSAQFDWLRALGHTVTEPLPSLFTFNLPGHPISALMGLSVERARVKIGGSKLAEEGPVLITHWGLSGPAVLRLSAWGARELATKNYHFTVHLNWVPDFPESALKSAFADARRAHPQKKVANGNPGGTPARLWEFLLQQSGIPSEQRFADLPVKAENALIRALTDSVFDVKGKTTFKEEFVTAGGVQLSEVDPNTLMSRKIPGLYFAGEVLDIDGITGGFNFQHAWTSGWIAAKLGT